MDLKENGLEEKEEISDVQSVPEENPMIKKTLVRTWDIREQGCPHQTVGRIYCSRGRCNSGDDNLFYDYRRILCNL